MPTKRTRSPGPTTSRSGLLLAGEVLGVLLDERLPLVGDLVLGEAGVDRAGLDAGVAVDALLRVDVELLDVVVVGLVGRRVDAVDRTDLDARVVLLPDAGLGDDVGHEAFGFLGNGFGGVRTLNSYGHHLPHGGRARTSPGGQARHRPRPRAPRPVPDRALSGPDLRPQSEVRPRIVVAELLGRGRGALQPALGRADRPPADD